MTTMGEGRKGVRDMTKSLANPKRRERGLRTWTEAATAGIEQPGDREGAALYATKENNYDEYFF